MNPLLLLLSLLLFPLASTLQTYPTHEFVTLDTVTDPDFGPLMSGDWSQRLPAEIRNYKEQILAKLHISHHEHRRNAKMSHRLKVMERFQWFLFWFIFATLALNNNFLKLTASNLPLFKISFPPLLPFSYLLCMTLLPVVIDMVSILVRSFQTAFYFLFVLMVSLAFFLLVFLFKRRKESRGEIFELVFKV